MIRKEMKYTPEQSAVLDALIAATGDHSYAELVRRLIEREAAKHEIVFPQNMPTKADNARKGMTARWGDKS